MGNAKKVLKDPEYFMVGNVLNAGEMGFMRKDHSGKHVTGTYVDEHNVTRTLTQETGPANGLGQKAGSCCFQILKTRQSLSMSQNFHSDEE